LLSRDADDNFISFVVFILCIIASHHLYTNFSYLNSRYATSWIACSLNLQLEKGGRGWNFRDHQSSFSTNHVRSRVFLSLVNGFYERRSYATILALTTRNGECEKDRITLGIIHKIRIMWILLRDLPRLTSPYNVRVRASSQVCYRLSTSYNSKTGGPGHRGSSTIANFV